MDEKDEPKGEASQEQAGPISLSLAGLPAPVTRGLVAAAATVTDDAHAGAGREELAEVVRSARVVQAWAESVEVEAARGLLRSVESDVTLDLGQGEPGSTRETCRREARRLVAIELELLTGLPATQCRDRVRVASATPARGGYLRQRLASGTVCLARAVTVATETAHLDPLTADQVARAVLTPPDGQPSRRDDPDSVVAENAAAAEQLPVSQGTFRRRLKRRLTKVESAAGMAARKRSEQVAGRDVRTEDGAFGTATTWVEASRERCYAAQQRVDAIARSARAAGDPRTIAQLRSDVATDLLIRGAVPGDELLGSPPAARLNVYVNLASVVPDPANGTVGDAAECPTAPVEAGEAARATSPTVRPGSDSQPAPDENDGGGTPGATAVPVRPVPVRPVPVRLGSDTRPGRVSLVYDRDGVGEVPGLGFLSADQVRELALVAGSTWRRLVTDPVTGMVLEACRTYRPTQAMRELVLARDRTCRAPGCEVAAREADLDHDVPWSPVATTAGEGATHPDNLHAMHRAHHHVKTRRWWSSEQNAEGVVRWESLTGQQVTTRPPGDGGVRPGADTRAPSPADAAIAEIFDHELDPPPLRDAELAGIYLATGRDSSADSEGQEG